MSKKNKNIEVEINESSKNKGDVIDLEVLVKKKVIGSIHKDSGDKLFSANLASGSQRNVTSVDQALQAIIEDYNLHDL